LTKPVSVTTWPLTAKTLPPVHTQIESKLVDNILLQIDVDNRT
jgi:hypothetical protein